MNNPKEHAPLLRADRVSKTYQDGQVQALSSVSMAVDRGEYVAVMGASGSGKSTLLNILGALDRPTRGEVYFEGQPLSQYDSLDRYRSRKLGFVFQSFHLLPMLTATENIQIPMFETRLSARRRAARAQGLLDLVGLSHRAQHLPRQLSVGERQRVAVARALANQPAMLLADEPTGNLDSANAAGIIDLFENLHRDRSLTILMVTHAVELAERAERTIYMRDGRVVEVRAMNDE